MSNLWLFVHRGRSESMRLSVAATVEEEPIEFFGLFVVS